MKKQSLIVLLVLLIGSANAQNTQETAQKYLALYTSMKFDDIGEYYTDQSIFEDPTMSFFDQAGNYEKKSGREEITTFLKEGFAKISNTQFNIEKEFTVGAISYSYGLLNYDYNVSREGQIKTLRIELPLAIILEVKEGKIIHHQDIADYNEWYRQYKNQLEQG